MQIEKLYIAQIQLETAIYLHLDKACYIPSITLAGAAEEILGQMLPSDKRAWVQISEALFSEYELTMTKADLRDNHLNRPKNSLKHNNCNEEKSIEMDPEIDLLPCWREY